MARSFLESGLVGGCSLGFLPRFVGLVNSAGPCGCIEARTREAVAQHAAQLTARWPNATVQRAQLFWDWDAMQFAYRATIWSRHHDY